MGDLLAVIGAVAVLSVVFLVGHYEGYHLGHRDGEKGKAKSPFRFRQPPSVTEEEPINVKWE